MTIWPVVKASAVRWLGKPTLIAYAALLVLATLGVVASIVFQYVR